MIATKTKKKRNIIEWMMYWIVSGKSNSEAIFSCFGVAFERMLLVVLNIQFYPVILSKIKLNS